MGNTPGVLQSIVGIAELLAAQSEFYRAASLAGWAQGMLDGPDIRLSHVDMHLFTRTMALARSQLGEQAWDEAWACGQMWTMDEAIAEALREVQTGT